MAVVRVKMIPGFYLGNDAVLLAVDREGMEAFERALSEKKQNGSPHFIASGTSHEFHIGGTDAQVQLEEGRVVWRLSEEKACEILDMLAGLKASIGPGHQYVDIDSPTETLILSKDEYLDTSWLNED